MAARRNKAGKGRTLAERADRHRLYELSVQDTEFEYDFVNATFRQLRDRTPRILCEDFCGTARMSCEWVRRRKRNRSYGIDLDPEVLAWARKHNLGGLSAEQRSRVRLLEADVLKAGLPEPADLILAMNFSYQVFPTRDRLRTYFQNVRSRLASDGVFLLDAFGGYDAYREIEEETEHEGFTYIWDQHRYDPVTGRLTCYIHFHFPDGSKLRRAFTYRWRLWTLPELQEILQEAGFRRVTVYWQGTDEEGEPDGNFQPVRHGEADAGWIAYLSAEP